MIGNSALFDSNIIIYLSKREIPLTLLFSTAILSFTFQNVKYLLLFWISLTSITFQLLLIWRFWGIGFEMLKRKNL